MQEPLAIIIVDDDDALRDSMDIMLTSVLPDVTVVLAESHRAAIPLIDQAAKTHERVMAILDMNFPGPDGHMSKTAGIQLARHIHKNHPAVPCMIMSGEVMPEIRDSLRRMGIAFLEKPASESEILDHIHLTEINGPGSGNYAVSKGQKSGMELSQK